MTTDDELRELIALGDKATPRPWRGDRYDGTVKYGIKGGSDNGYVLLYNDDAERSQFSRDLGNCDDEFIIAAANLAPDIARELIAAREALAKANQDADALDDEILTLMRYVEPGEDYYRMIKKHVAHRARIGGDL